MFTRVLRRYGASTVFVLVDDDDGVGFIVPRCRADVILGTSIYSVSRLANLTEDADSVGLTAGDFGR